MSEVYQVTHILFYVGDFGFQPAWALPSADREAIGAIVASLLRVYLCERNWDLVGELLMAARSIAMPVDATSTLAWHSLAAAQAPDGSLRGPFFEQDHHRKLRGEKRRAYEFDQNYHTTIVGAMAGLIWPPAVPGSPVPGRTSSRSGDPTHRRVRLAMDRAHDWLRRDPRFDDPVGAMPALIAEWCYHRTRGDSAGHLAALARQWQRAAREISPGQVFRVDPLLTVAVDSILKVHGLEVLELSRGAAFIREKAADMAHRGVASAAVAALGQSGWLPQPPPMNLRPYAGLTLWSRRETFEDISARTSALVRFGMRLGALKPSQRENLAMMLTSRLELAFRQYDLGLGMGLLRALQDIGYGSSRPVLNALDFLAAQQRPDGSVGFFRPSENAGPAPRMADTSAADLALLATSSAMWTWAEAISPRFRLLLSLRPDGPLVKAVRRPAQWHPLVHRSV